MAALQEFGKEFADRAIERHGLMLLRASDAVQYVARCEENAIAVLGVDGFLLEGDRIQPLMEHSVDLSQLPRPAGWARGGHEEAAKFLRSRRDSDLWFEVVVETAARS